MSQEKVDKYKQQKKDRKNPKKVSKIKKVVPYVITTIVVLAILGFLGISVAKQTGCYTPPTEAREWSEQEIQSFRQVLIQATDQNVQYTTVAPETKAATKKANNSKKVEVTKKASAKTTKKADK